MWSPVKGAELYETTAAQTNDVIHCNDTAPVCALSDLTCNTVYTVTVTPCSDLRGCNRTCVSHTHETGIKSAVFKIQVKYTFVFKPHFLSVLLQLPVLQRSWTWRRPTTPHTRSSSVPPTPPTQITPSPPSDATTNTPARQETTRVNSRSCTVARSMKSQLWPPQPWGEVYLDSVKLWKQVWLVLTPKSQVWPCDKVIMGVIKSVGLI